MGHYSQCLCLEKNKTQILYSCWAFENTPGYLTIDYIVLIRLSRNHDVPAWKQPELGQNPLHFDVCFSNFENKEFVARTFVNLIDNTYKLDRK